MENIIFQYPKWYLLFCLLLGVIYALFMYYRDGRFEDKGAWLKALLGTLRTLAVGILAFLLLSPLIKSIIENQKNPSILILEDASASIKKGLGEDFQSYQTNINKLSTSLEEKYDVKRFHFGDKVETGRADTLDKQITNLSNALKYISENYGDQNIGAVILSSDGIYNEGSNPIYQNTEITAPVYTIAIGDTTQRKDLIVKDVFHNKIVYLNDQFNLQVDIAATNCSNQSSILEVFEVTDNGSKKLKEEKIIISGNDFFTTREITIEAKRSGIVRYQVKLKTINGEALTSNNKKDIYVEILDARQKIILLANAPHPDLAAIKSAILNNKNYTVDVKFMQRDAYNIADYNMVVFHDLPSRKNNIASVLSTLNKKRTPRLFIVGRQTNLSAFNKSQEVLTISGNNTQSDDVQANFRANFSSFTLDETLKRSISKFPPLTAPFGKYTRGAKVNTLMQQRIGRVDTDYPLLAFSDLKNTKTAVLAAEGIWKWKLADFMENQNHERYNAIMTKIIQYTTVKDDKRKFRADVNKNVFKENEAVKIEAQLFNDSYEAVNEPDVFLSLFDSNKKEFKYTFSKRENYYHLEPGFFKEGNYRFKAKVNFNGKELVDEGKFSVKSIQLEQYDLTARHNVLFNLSKKTGGQVFHDNQLDSLSASLINNNKIKPIIYTSNKTQSILNLRWLLGALIILLIAEWFLRRYHGTY